MFPMSCAPISLAPNGISHGLKPLRRPVALGDLHHKFGGQLSRGHELIISGVRQDSRCVEAGDLFVALRGATSDGAQYIKAAIEGGAAAVMIEAGRSVESGQLPVWQVEKPRVAMARSAALVYGEPTAELDVVGITGTNGKTTTAHLVHAGLTGCGARAGLVGTLGYRFENLSLPARHTSPESDELQRVAGVMRDGGASHLVMEVSSIGLAAQRVEGVRFAVAVFTNLSQDHLDYHGSMERYAAEKDRLFLEMAPTAAVINIDDAHGAELAKVLAGRGESRLITVSRRSDASADIVARRLEMNQAGVQMSLQTPQGPIELQAPLIGNHNAENILSTVAVLHALGIDLERAAEVLATVKPVPGRLERCDRPGVDDITVIVDYAHTPDALIRLLESVRPFTQGQLWCVFGCGGDRDAAKRDVMGEAVGRAADQAVVTNDNPRSEDPQKIADAIIAGLERLDSKQYRVELDRAKAIEQTIAEASAGDVVLIAGKGHETYQILGDQTTDFDDRVWARTSLARRRGEEGSC